MTIMEKIGSPGGGGGSSNGAAPPPPATTLLVPRTAHIEIGIHPACSMPMDEVRKEWQHHVRSIVISTTLQTPPMRLDIHVLLQTAPLSLQQTYGGQFSIHVEDNVYLSLEGLDRYQVMVHVFVLNVEDPIIQELEPNEGESEWTAACDCLSLPHQSLVGLWETLKFDIHVKPDLLHFAASALLFADKAVSTNLIRWNRLILLHGPPGTGKTSLCRALAQKLAIRMSDRYHRSMIMEIQSHSLFSKWFSTSGKLVNKLFELIRETCQEDPNCLLFVLIDEIESLAASRSNAHNKGSEPTDAMRAVNALLTSLDRLASYPNVLILATTNLTESVDTAFLDRTDLKIFIGPPSLEARYEILRSCLDELMRVGIVDSRRASGQVSNSLALVSSSSTSTPQATNHNNKNNHETDHVGGNDQYHHHHHRVPSGDDSDFDRIDRLDSFHILRNNRHRKTENNLRLFSLAQSASGLSGRSLRRLPLQAHAMYVRPQHPQQDACVTLRHFLDALERAMDRELESSDQLRAVSHSDMEMEI